MPALTQHPQSELVDARELDPFGDLRREPLQQRREHVGQRAHIRRHDDAPRRAARQVRRPVQPDDRLAGACGPANPRRA